ncbi:MAG TPA: AAA family ATPase [Nitrospiraceae bacterium]|jgi:SpoVK/Ycf46/Vps4 family AAA+-type ATPase|nr:AAA family ATPase [Nitrospiraceae bacterium]
MDNVNVQDLLRIIESGNSLFYVVTDNEQSTERIVTQVAARIKGAGSPFVWTCTEGFIREGASFKDTVNPLPALDFAIAQPGSATFLFKDLSNFWANNPFIIRKLKEFAVRARSKIIIVIGEEETVPERLREDLVILYQGIPVVAEIKAHLELLKGRVPLLTQACAADPELVGKLVVAAQGLSLEDIERSVGAFNQSQASSGSEIVRAFFETKQQIIRKSGIMEFVVNDTAMDHLGGMENLKNWLQRRETAFGLDNISSGVNMPKGVLIMGISGCGKSLFVKVIATRWRLPLIRLDMGVVYGGAFGSPESSLRRALRTAEAIAPCVLWIDEIEAGISSQGFKAEGGAASRVLGSFLTWMQEKNAPVFVAATANAIEILPAELLRKGRFDEIFYMGLPDETAREEIFRIHMKKQNIDPSGIDVGLLARLAKRFSGAEVEQVVKSAAFEALADKRPIVEEDFLAVLRKTVPLAVTMNEQIGSIEAWAFKRAVPASGQLNR